VRRPALPRGSFAGCQVASIFENAWSKPDAVARKRSTRLQAVSICSLAREIENENDDEHEHDSIQRFIRTHRGKHTRG
jgi:hypothetical protein